MVPAVLEYIWVQFRLESGFMNCGCRLSGKRRSVSPLYLAFDRGHMLEGLYCHFIKFPATIHTIFYIDQIYTSFADSTALQHIEAIIPTICSCKIASIELLSSRLWDTAPTLPQPYTLRPTFAIISAIVLLLQRSYNQRTLGSELAPLRTTIHESRTPRRPPAFQSIDLREFTKAFMSLLKHETIPRMPVSFIEEQEQVRIPKMPHMNRS